MSIKRLYPNIINEHDYEIDNRDARTTELHFSVESINGDVTRVLLRIDPVLMFLNMLENLPEPEKPFTGRSPKEAREVVVDWLCRIEVLDRETDPDVEAILYDPDGDDAE